MKRWTRLLAPAISIAVASLSINCPAALAADPLTIAVAGPMSGDLARYGEPMRQGAEQAVAEINAQGGVLGRPLKLLVEDDRCDPTHAAAAAQDVVDGGAVFVAGHFCSGVSIPASKVYHEHGILMITPESSNPRLTDEAADAGWNTVFRVYGRDDAEAAFAGAWISASFKGQPVAVVTDGSGYSEQLSRSARAAMAAAGVKPALEDSIATGMDDYSQLMNELKADQIRVLYFAGYHPEAAVIARQIHDRGLPVQLVGSDSLNDQEFLAAADFAADGVMFTAEADATRFSGAQALDAAFQAAGITPTDTTIRTYAAVRLWADAAAKAGSTDGDKVAAVLRGGSWNTVLGVMAFDAKGDPTGPNYAIYIVSGGKIGELRN